MRRTEPRHRLLGRGLPRLPKTERARGVGGKGTREAERGTN